MFFLIFFIIVWINTGESFPDNSPEEYLMTSANIEGVKRSNICGDGYRIEGAVLRSYPYSKNETYLPYENCSMTFQSRRPTNSILIRIITLDLNDISNGRQCFDTLHFYNSLSLNIQDRLDSVECGQLTEANNFSLISSTGIVTAHFLTDSGNVNGHGFKVILTSFRSPNQTHPCNSNDDEYLCHSGECISSSLLHDAIPHCPDKSDEESTYPTSRSRYGKTMFIILFFSPPSHRNLPAHLLSPSTLFPIISSKESLCNHDKNSGQRNEYRNNLYKIEKLEKKCD